MDGVSDQVGKQVSVYIRAEDLPVWARAERYARERRMPMSGLVVLAVERYLAAEEDPQADRA